MELSIDRIRPNELALSQGVAAAETEDGSVSKVLIPVMSLEPGSGSRQLRDCCDHASKHSCKGVTLTVPTRFRSRIFKFAEFSCAQKLSKWALFSLDFGWRPDVSALCTFILARSKRYLTAPPVMSRTHAVSAVLRFLTSCRKSTSRYFTDRVSIARRNVSPSFFLRSASQAISRQSAKSFAILPDRDLRLSVRSLSIAAKTISKLPAVTGSVFVLILIG